MALTPEQIERAKRLATTFPIEMAEVRASTKQLRFQRMFFDRRDEDGRRVNVMVALGGNRSGKSICAGRLCFAKYLRDRARNGDTFWCVAVTLDRSIGGQQKELWQALPRWMFGDQTWSEKIGFGAHRKVTLPTFDGGTCLVEFRSADQHPSTFEQAKLTGVWCDERMSESIYDRLLPRVIDRDGWILYSDIPEQVWQHERLVNAEPAAGVYFEHFEMHDNAHNLPPGAIEKTAAQMTPDERRKRIEGLFVVLEGVVYREYNDETHTIDPFRIPANWPKWRAIDYGSSAPTACTWLTIGDDETCYVYREYHQANLSIEKNAAAIIALSVDHTGRPEAYRKTLMDPHAVDQPPVVYGAAKTIAQQYADAGIVSTGWPFVQVLGEHAMVQRVKQRLEVKMLRVFKTCTHTRREFRSWRYKTDAEGKPLASDAFSNENCHLLDTIKGFFGTRPCFSAGTVTVEDRRR